MIQPSRRIAPWEREELVKQTQDLLEKGLLGPVFLIGVLRRCLSLIGWIAKILCGFLRTE